MSENHMQTLATTEHNMPTPNSLTLMSTSLRDMAIKSVLWRLPTLVAIMTHVT